jgi:predicted small integral membrane protein
MIAVRVAKIVLVRRWRCTPACASAISPTTAPILRATRAVDGYHFPIPGSATRDRNPALHHLAYALIIAAETLTTVLCWIGALRLFAQLRSGVAAFNRAKAFAIAGLLMGLLVWQVGFMTIAGEWFGMWMSQTWNGLPSAFRLVMIFLGVLIFVTLPDGELDRQPAG